MNEFQKAIEAGLTKKPKFDPNGSGYDEETFNAAGLKRGPDGHASSLNPYNGMLLKGRNHPTFGWTMNAEKSLGNVLVVGKDGRYYSRKEGDLQEGEKPIEYTPEELAKAESAKQENNKQVFEKDFQSAVEAGLTKKREDYKKPETAYGFPIDHNVPLELNDWFAKNPSTAGMVWGKGVNASPKDAPMSIAINPYSEGMKNPKARDAVIRNEAARILMRDNPVKDFEITPQMKAWREKTFPEGHPYRSDDQAFRQTLVARMISEGGLGEPTPDVMSEMKRYSDELNKRK